MNFLMDLPNKNLMIFQVQELFIIFQILINRLLLIMNNYFSTHKELLVIIQFNK